VKRLFACAAVVLLALSYETVIGLAEVGPNASIGRHSRPGIEGGCLIEGDMTLLVEASKKHDNLPL